MASLERNLRLYPAYQACRNLLFWLPVFFLYFSSHLPPDRVLELEALYYLSVVLLEVPSGYFSDRIGRKPTLIIASAFWAGSSVLYASSSTFVGLAIAQVCLAGGMAFHSGTDAALLYDSLAAKGRGAEYGEREGRAHRVGFIALGLSSLIGGALAGVDLRLAYVLSALAGIAGLVVSFSFHEPPRAEVAAPPLRQAVETARTLGDPVLRWVFVFVVGMIIWHHVPPEFAQPYIEFLIGGEDGGYAPTPLASGAMVGVAMLVSAWASGRAIDLSRRVGPGRAMLLALLLQGLVIGAMAWALHPMVLLLLLVRGVPSALMTPIAGSLVQPRVSSGMRATWLSMQSLAGRLSFSGTLAISAFALRGSEEWTPEGLQRVLVGFAIACGAALAAMTVARPRELRSSRDDS